MTSFYPSLFPSLFPGRRRLFGLLRLFRAGVGFSPAFCSAAEAGRSPDLLGPALPRLRFVGAGVPVEAIPAAFGPSAALPPDFFLEPLPFFRFLFFSSKRVRLS